MILLALLYIVVQTESARILVFIPTPSFSHNVVLQPLWKELSLRGHHVTTLTSEPIKDPLLVNLTEIKLSFSYKTMLKDLQEKTATMDHLAVYKFGYLRHAEVVDEQLGHPLVQAIIKNESETFDLVMVESSRLPILAFSHRFACPSIGITTLDAYPVMYSLLGNPTHPVLYSDTWLDLEEPSSIVQRLLRVLYDVQLFWFQKKTLFPLYDEIIKDRFGKGYPSVEELMKAVDVQFVNTDPIFHTVRAVTPNVVQIGGSLHRLPQKPLSKELQTLLGDAKEGFIYFSFGSYAKSNSLSPKVLNTILETFADLPYMVLWKFESDYLPNKTKNVITSRWVTQTHVLNHPNIKLFITHSGLQSLNEAIDAGVPILGIPLFADQPHNVQRMVLRGCGLSLRLDKLEKNSFRRAVDEVITNPKYRKKVEQLRELARDQPMSGLDRAIWWTEYVLRHKGAKHLRSPLIDIPFYQYYLIDVIGFIVVLMLITVTFILKLFSFILSFCIKSNLKKKKT